MPLFGPNIKKMEKNADIEGLIQAFKHENSRTRQEAVLALERLGWKPQNDEDKAWVLAAKRNWQEVIALAETAIPPLFVAMSHSHKAIAEEAGDALEKIALSDPEKYLPILCAAINNQLIETSLGSKLDHARSRTARILGKMRDGRAIPPLLKSAKKFHDLDYRQHKNELQPAKTVTAKSDAYSILVKKVIQEIGPAAILTLSEMLDSKKESTRIEAINALGSIHDERIFEILVSTLQDKSVSIRNAGLTAISQVNDKRVVEYLVEALRDTHYAVRKNACTQLIKRSWRPTNPEDKVYFALAKLFQNMKREGIQTVDWKALRSVSRETVHPLIRSLHLEGDIFYTVQTYKAKKFVQEPARIWVIEMLVKNGKKTKPELIEALQDPDPMIRQGAEEALKRIR